MGYKQKREGLHSSVKKITETADGWRKEHSISITYRGKTKGAYEWAKEKNIRYSTLLARVHAGWSASEIFNTPVANHKYDKTGRRVVRNDPRSSYECVPRKIHESAHPIMKAILLEMRKMHMTYEQMHKGSGVSYPAQQMHKRGHMGLFTNVEAMANTVGFDIVVKRRKKSR